VILAKRHRLEVQTYVKWQHGMRCLALPDDESRNTEDANNERCNDLGCPPLRLDTACDSKWLPSLAKSRGLTTLSSYCQDAPKHRDQQNDARDI
jgi:hypothetical protein